MLPPPVSSGPQLETPRLILRPPVKADLKPYKVLHREPEQAEFHGGVMPEALIWRSFCSVLGGWVLDGFGMFSVVEKSSKTWVGLVGPMAPSSWPEVEVGWSLLNAATGKGYALEATIASVDYVFFTLNRGRIIHSIHPSHTASQKLAASLGAINLGPNRLPAPYLGTPVEMWSLDRNRWSEHRKTFLDTHILA